MVSSVLWISVATLAFLRLAETGSEYALLHEGEKCGEYDQGRCESGLICVPDNPEPELFNAVGVCTRVPGCNCSEFQCLPRQGCRGRQVIDPCGCCTHCAKTKGQVCGGPSWRYGNCDPDLVCALVVGLDSARPPQTGVCKVIPKHLKKHFPVPLCPVQNGCNVHVGNCDCYSDQSCDSPFSYSTYEACNKVLMAFLMYDFYANDMETPPKPEVPAYECKEWSCEVQACECVCQYRKCVYRLAPLNEAACCDVLKESGCLNTSCPGTPTLACPADSFISEPHTEPGHCCPVVPAMCTCDFQTCTPKPTYCPNRGLPRLLVKGNGHPGTCCDRYECVKEGD